MAVNNTKRLAGLASIALDGVTFSLVGDLEYGPSSVKRETLIGMDSVHGYKETPMAQFLSFTLRDDGEMTVGAFNGMTFTTGLAQLANGKGIMVSGAWCIDSQEVNAAEGTFKVRFETNNLIELLA